MNLAKQIIRAKSDYDEVYKSGKLSVLKDSKYMHPTVSGTAISANDVNPTEHNLGVSVRSKNLLDFASLNWLFASGVDGSITPTENGFLYSSSALFGTTELYASKNPWIKSGVTYTYSYNILSVQEDLSTFTVLRSNAVVYYTDGTYKEFSLNGYITQLGKYSMQITTDANKEVNKIALRPIRKNDTNMINIEIGEIQLELGTEATPYTPYIADLSGVEVSRYGKNIFDYDFCSNYENTIQSTYRFVKIANIQSGKYYTWSGLDAETLDSLKEIFSVVVLCKEPNYNSVITSNYRYIQHPTTPASNKYTFYVPAGRTEIYLGAYNSSWDETKWQQFIKCFENFMIEIGNTVTEYEVGNNQSSTANADGTVNGLTSLSPNMTLIPDIEGVAIDLNYYRDIDTYIDNLMIDVALTEEDLAEIQSAIDGKNTDTNKTTEESEET